MSGEESGDELEDLQFVMVTVEISSDAARVLLERCEWCVEEAIEWYFSGEVSREELELEASRQLKGKVPACQFYWNGRCPNGEKCLLSHGDGNHTSEPTGVELFTRDTNSMDFHELLELGDSMGHVPTPLDTSVKSRLRTVTLAQAKIHIENCPICIEQVGRGTVLTELPCSHAFHTSCIGKWFEGSRVCPICKKEVTLPPLRPPTPPKIKERNLWGLKRKCKT
eukprot:TRINITY_DN2585_c1_g3_i1.p1 TRINITY_DN2585_c1_g3~~TRINITY_DN2585_c1_g3_i1.p1  ORF type:complete len:224 (+),score=30.86 TRINITY_DN2585_c1_g3_i1:56-727(+)